MGMRYLDEVNGKLPANISEVEKAYKLLGITSREEANKMADSQLKAFNVMMNSGTASAENIKQALINMADKIYASGDAAKIAWYEAQLSANGLQSSVDSLGKASVKSMDDLSDSVDRVGRTARDLQLMDSVNWVVLQEKKQKPVCKSGKMQWRRLVQSGRLKMLQITVAYQICKAASIKWLKIITTDLLQRV
jgi:hypothetical protein